MSSINLRVKNDPAGNKLIGTFDCETDPFKYGADIRPFAACVYFSADDLLVLWESDSKRDFARRILRALRNLPPCTLYAHNGGKFDFHFLLEYAEPQQLKIYGSRVMEMKIGDVTLKDSYPLMPFPLEEYRKDEIDYAIFTKYRRNAPRNKARIVDYLISDCANLLELVSGFRRIVGPKDTIGSAAFYNMKQLGIEITNGDEAHDDIFRPYYFGGRVEAFQKGIHRGPFKFIDINSAYPFAMLSKHAHGTDYERVTTLPAMRELGPCFVHCIARSKGALPLRGTEDVDFETLAFPTDFEPHEYFATGWEIAAGLATKTLRVEKVIEVWKPENFISFEPFVETYYARRLNAKRNKDEIGRLAYKYLLNSGYGKFAQNPREFKEWQLAPYGENVRGYDWECDFGAMSLWQRKVFRGDDRPDNYGYYDVATGASITGFVRAFLWRSVCASKGVIYCDTDAMLCRASNVPLGDKLGQWKLEGNVALAAIAGKKLYGVEWEKSSRSVGRYKVASKGARLTFADIVRLCKGGVVNWQNQNPTFSLGNIHYIEREIRAT